jgi:transcription-repair coupling factor (superfamily II helicase)
VRYAGSDRLFLPAEQLDRLSKYIGSHADDGTLTLSKFGGGEWTRAKTRAKASLKKIAADLIKLYAERSRLPGHAFPPDDAFQREFEEAFEFEETEAQLEASGDIKRDMMKSAPMDRLLCGDVGFGKTEVAFRAALKCILSGKQCVILAPTTVLAHQHYETAIRRFESVPIHIELLSRFRTKKQQTEILKKTANGTIDLLIGTHRLLSKDVKFASLGLAVIDEEQRFGVAHKERFKEVFNGIDILTLSATPIPRTLNMALSGIRDMSVIEEPPQDRYPVQSFVLEYDAGLIVQAIQRELKRGGQVYYIHNRVETIRQCAGKLQDMLPDARIGYAHGKMSELEISEVWNRLVEHDIDILVCTTIIETGVDVPNVNTLILEQADRFGLSQLYQLRGRVGR